MTCLAEAMLFLFTLAVVGAFSLYVMKPEERVRLLRKVVEAAQPIAGAAAPGADEKSFREALRARTTLAIVTPTLIVVTVVMFIRMLFGEGSLADPATLIAWGGNFAPRTTNGEWWRLTTSIFIHGSFIDLVFNVIGLLAIGFVLERLVGHIAFAAVYIAAGIAGSLASLFAYPLVVNTGGTAALVGLYGLFAAASLWSIRQRTAVTIPLAVVKRLGPAAGVFVLYVLFTGGLSNVANTAGLVVGLALGLLLARGISENKPPIRRAAAALAATVAIAMVCSVPLRGIADIGPEIAQVVAAEDRTANTYQHAVSQFVKGRATAAELATLIEGTIIPDLQAAGARLRALGKVASEQQHLVANAAEYVRLRGESWRLRAEGLRKGNMRTLKEADMAERASLVAFERIRPADVK